MRNFTVAILICLALPGGLCIAQNKVIVAIGSSTTFGYGASTFDSSWVGRSITYYGPQGLGVVKTIYDFGQPGATTAAGMPTGTRGVPGQYDTTLNITAAMKLNPDVVIINFPSNDIVLDTPMAAFLSNLRTMYNIVTSAGKICYVTTTQPRTTYSNQQTLNLLIGRDSIMKEFAPFALDFYEPLTNPDSIGFNPLYLSVSDPGDTIHPNDAGHALLFGVVKNNVVLDGTPLALLLTGFSAAISGGTAHIRWTTVDEQSPTTFAVQKSADGQDFTTVYQQEGKGGGQANAYSWTDNVLLPGASYYRLQIIEPGKESYSAIASLNNGTAGGLIAKMFMQNTVMLSVELNIAQQGPVGVAVFASNGSQVWQQALSASGTSATISIPLTGLASGVYFLRITDAAGNQETKAFSRF